jgi:hypothetical protein
VNGRVIYYGMCEMVAGTESDKSDMGLGRIDRVKKSWKKEFKKL